MKVHVLTPSNVNENLGLLEQFHRLRYDIFVRDLQRNDLVSTSDMEHDVWDTPLFKPVRFLLTEDDGYPIGAARMVSSLATTMFEANYSDYLFKPHEKRSDLWEIQRLGIRLNLDARQMEAAILELLIAIHEWSNANGVRDVMLLTFTGIAKKRLETMHAIGPPKLHIGFDHVALQGRLDPLVLQEWKSRRNALVAPIPGVAVA